MSGPSPNLTEPTGLSRAMQYSAYMGMIVLLGGGAMFFGAWLYLGYAAALGWPPMVSSMGFLVAPALLRAIRSNLGWPRVLLAFLETGTVTVLLIANIVAATALLWALDPSLATGRNGWIGPFLIGVVLTLPVILGAAKLEERLMGSGLPWREWFRSEHSRRRTGLGFLLGLAGFALCRASVYLLENWLRAAYPGVNDHFVSSGSGVGILVLFLLVGTGPSDMRSTLRSLLAALVVFETVIASAITVAVVTVTLQSDSLLLFLADMLPVSAVFIGAWLLIACRPGRWDAEATGDEEEAEA